MFTVCPKCALTLVVTAADLRVAQGYVRCGRCLNVFNALARLSEERPPAATVPPPPPEAPPQQELSPQPSEPSSAVDEAGEIEIELDASALLRSPHEPTGPPQSSAEPEASQVTESKHAPQERSLPMEPPREPPASPLDGEPAAQETQDAAVLPEEPQPPSSAPAPEAPQTNIAQQQPQSAFEIGAPRPRASLAWKLGAGALALALALQIVNHYRDALAANPALRGPLSSVYSTLGVKLAPQWNVHAYDVRQLGASVSAAAAGEITVRASVKNSASHAQPLPLLRVTLQDRFGNRIAARDVPPGDYLPSSVPQSSLLAAGSRVDATMVFMDPGPQAVGFEIDACLRRRGGEVACAHGP